MANRKKGRRVQGKGFRVQKEMADGRREADAPAQGGILGGQDGTPVYLDCGRDFNSTLLQNFLANQAVSTI
ncbi:MAG: hypothetical protein V4726_04430, partial [Verrucomicrobiota bacterium]